MRKMLYIALNDLRVFFKEPGALVTIILVPTMLMLAIGYGIGQTAVAPTQVRVDVLNNDGSALTERLLEQIRAANNALVLCPMDDRDGSCRLDGAQPLTAEAISRRLLDKVTQAALEIPAGFGAALDSGQTVTLIYRSNNNAGSPGIALQAVQAAAQRLSGAQVAAQVGLSVAEAYPPVGFTDDADRSAFRQGVYDHATTLWTQNPVRVNYVQSTTPNAPATSSTQAGFGQSVPGMGSMFVMFTVMTALYAILRERRNWTFQRLVMMPVDRRSILAGKILMWFTAGMIEYAIVFGIGLLIGLNLGNDLLALLLVMVSFTLCITALTFTISTLVKTDAQANSTSNLLALSLAPLGGAWWPLEIVPPFMRSIGHISPVAWAMDAYNKLLFEQGTLVTVLPEIGVLLAITAVLFFIAVRRFKYE